MLEGGRAGGYGQTERGGDGNTERDDDSLANWEDFISKIHGRWREPGKVFLRSREMMRNWKPTPTSGRSGAWGGWVSPWVSWWVS